MPLCATQISGDIFEKFVLDFIVSLFGAEVLPTVVTPEDVSWDDVSEEFVPSFWSVSLKFVSFVRELLWPEEVVRELLLLSFEHFEDASVRIKQDISFSDEEHKQWEKYQFTLFKLSLKTK